MELSLTSESIEFHLSVPPAVATVINQQMSRMVTEEARSALAATMLRQLVHVLGKLLDPDLKPPTERQLDFAKELARRHGVQIPRDALIYQFSMADFIDKFVNKRPPPAAEMSSSGS